MTEEDARGWLGSTLSVPRETVERLDHFIGLLREEAARQNLIAASTLDSIWSRHIVDSAQLLSLAKIGIDRWLDLGSGAGFPGLIVGLLSNFEVTLVEARRKRVEFLLRAVECLGIGDTVEVVLGRVETLSTRRYDVISARAFAPLDRLLSLAHRFADNDTAWLLPKGRSAASELEAVRGSWQGAFRIAPSVTDPDGAIIVATGVKPKPKG